MLLLFTSVNRFLEIMTSCRERSIILGEVEMRASLVIERDTNRKEVHEAGFGFKIKG
jgi:hypothetical protein